MTQYQYHHSMQTILQQHQHEEHQQGLGSIFSLGSSCCSTRGLTSALRPSSPLMEGINTVLMVPSLEIGRTTAWNSPFPLAIKAQEDFFLRNVMANVQPNRRAYHYMGVLY